LAGSSGPFSAVSATQLWVRAAHLLQCLDRLSLQIPEGR